MPQSRRQGRRTSITDGVTIKTTDKKHIHQSIKKKIKMKKKTNITTASHDQEITSIKTTSSQQYDPINELIQTKYQF